ncbi:MAG: DNA translocase FtsK, partial [Desulfovibrionaceae bacterium]|nr:DNA translocase FtsK [Desulfovibrionaceae bacterium]
DMADDMAGEPAAAPAALSARRAASAGQAAQVSKAPAKRPSAVKIDRLYRDESADGLDDEPAVAAPGTEYVQKPEPALDDDEEAEDDIEERSAALMSCLADFGIQAELVRATPGPVVTTYMLRPAPGVSVRVFTRHTEDIARALMAVSVFIQAPVPGTDTVGIVIPNQHRAVVNFREIASTEAFRDAQGALPLIVGKDTTGRPYVADLARMPHLLVAGATGQGKSVCLNAMLTSLLLTRTPDRLKLLLVDPKRVEMGMYEDESHLVHPVVKEVSDAKNALLWAVHEMDERYSRMARLNTKNIIGYNARLESFKGALPADLADLEPMPYIVIVIDELADLMLQARKDVEPCIIRLAQLARACGIHMIIATQRPSVDVVTGLIKANFPCRICFRVSSRQDSMTTLGNAGAEKLLGNGDMFFNPNGGHLTRLHGPYLRDEEVQAVVDFWKKQARPNYEVDFATWGTEEEEGPARSGRPDGGERDAMYQEVLEFISEKGHVSISLLQRRFNIGYNKAARYMDQLDADGLVGPSPGAGKPRPVLR